MKIAIDSRGATWYHGTGIGTYTENILKEILNIDEENNYMLYWSGEPKDYIMKSDCKKILTSRKHHRFFQNHFFPHNLLRNEIDLYHVPQNGIGLSTDIHCLKVATIHDLIPYIMPETVGKGYLCKFLKEMPYIIDCCDGLLTVSEYSKQDILRFFPSFDPDKIFVTPLAANSNFHPFPLEESRTILKEKYNIDYKFFMYMGGFSDRKNVAALIRAYNDVRTSLPEDIKLVILGSYRDPSQKLRVLCEDLGISENVNFAGFIPEEDVAHFYNGCHCFVYPSQYEGFGLPPLEAMSCGAPVICSNTTSIPEVVDECGIYISPDDYHTISQALFKISSDDALRTSLSKNGLNRSSQFSWRKTAQSTVDAYNKIFSLSSCTSPSETP